MFGDIREVKTLRDFWGSYWHQNLRRVCGTLPPEIFFFTLRILRLMEMLDVHRLRPLCYKTLPHPTQDKAGRLDTDLRRLYNFRSPACPSILLPPCGATIH